MAFRLLFKAVFTVPITQQTACSRIGNFKSFSISTAFCTQVVKVFYISYSNLFVLIVIDVCSTYTLYKTHNSVFPVLNSDGTIAGDA